MHLARLKVLSMKRLRGRTMDDKLIELLEKQLRIIYEYDTSDPVTKNELVALSESFIETIEGE